MAFNGSGTFVRLYSWVNDAAANIKIRADRMDNETNGIAVGLSTCITKDGQTTITANLPMAGYRHTGVGNATDRAHYAKFSQLQDGTPNWIDGGGTADAITAAYAIPLTALIDGQLCFVRATAANATTTPTFSPSALTARTIVKNGGSALAVGDIAGDGHELILRYDLANTRWELLNPKVVITSIPYTAASASGSASLEFAEDTDNGTNKATVAAPATLAADAAITLPGVTGTLATLAGSEALTNKSVNGVTLSAAASASTFLSGAGTYTSPFTLGTPVPSTSGTSIDFTGIPSTARMIVINFVGVSTNGTDNWLIQIGDSGGVETSGYSSGSYNVTGGATGTSTSGFLLLVPAAAAVAQGTITLALESSSTNTWCASGSIATSDTFRLIFTSGSKPLSATLDRVRVTTTGGTNTFDAGEINILYA